MNRDDATDGRCVSRVGGVVVLHGAMLKVCLDALLIATRARKLNGLPISAAHRELAAALTAAVTVDGHVDVPETPAVTPSIERPTITIEQAATTLGVSRRQTRRLAPKLGGRIVAGRWLLDEQAIDEHMKGRRKWTRQCDRRC